MNSGGLARRSPATAGQAPGLCSRRTRGASMARFDFAQANKVDTNQESSTCHLQDLPETSSLQTLIGHKRPGTAAHSGLSAKHRELSMSASKQTSFVPHRQDGCASPKPLQPEIHCHLACKPRSTAEAAEKTRSWVRVLPGTTTLLLLSAPIPRTISALLLLLEDVCCFLADSKQRLQYAADATRQRPEGGAARASSVHLPQSTLPGTLHPRMCSAPRMVSSHVGKSPALPLVLPVQMPWGVPMHF